MVIYSREKSNFAIVSFGERSVIDSFVTIALDIVRLLKFILTIVIWINLMCHERNLLESAVRSSTNLKEAVEARPLKGERHRQLVVLVKNRKNFVF
jgi:hypothetical protein